MTGALPSATSDESTPEVMALAEVSVLVVDGTRLSREALADLLRRGDWAGEVRTAADAGSAAVCLNAARPDVVLLNMASSDALETLAAVRSLAPAAPVVALGVNEREQEIVAYAEGGVAGFLPKDGTAEDLAAAVAGVIRGEAVCSPRIAGALLRRVTTLAEARTAGSDNVHLTPREREVLMLIEQGLTNKQIAACLGIEVRTVKNHAHNLFEKLRVRHRGEAAARLRGARVPAVEALRVGAPLS